MRSPGQVTAAETGGATAAALGLVLAGPTTGHLAVLGATLGNLTSLVDCNAAGESAQHNVCRCATGMVANRHVLWSTVRSCHPRAVAQHQHCDLRNRRASDSQTARSCTQHNAHHAELHSTLLLVVQDGDPLATPDGLTLAAIGFALSGMLLYVLHHLSTAKTCAKVEEQISFGSE